jgi:hypothetical protein
MTSPNSGPPFTSLDVIHRLTDRELSEAIFLMLCAFAERSTGRVPCLVAEGSSSMPTLIHGADGRVAWLEPPAVAARSCESAPGPHCRLVPTPDKELAAP